MPMRQVSRGLLLSAVLVAAFGVASGRATAQAAAKGEAPRGGEPVKFTTIDGVDLHGLFFQSAKKDAPTVMFIHALGDKAQRKEHLALAQELQASCSVLLFDLRGHGKSKDIDPEKFWKYGPNAKLVKGAPKKTTIEYVDFDKSYYPFIANDLAAAKAFLDRKNDTGACNTASTILIGAETGATLGAIWLNSEWYLYKLIPGVNAFRRRSGRRTPRARTSSRASG